MQELQPAWNELLACSSARTIFLTQEWLTCWWRAYGTSQELLLLGCFEDNGRLVGIAPLYRRRRVLGPGFAVRELRLIGVGSGESHNLDLIIKEGHERAAVRAFLDWLSEHRSDWDILELAAVPSESRVLKLLCAELEERRWYFLHRQWPHLVVPLPESWEVYLARLPEQMRQSVLYKLRRLDRRYHVRLRKCETKAELLRSLDALIELHRKRWHLRGGSAVFDLGRRHSFYSEMAEQFLARGWLDFWLLDLNDQPAAASFGFRYGNTHFFLMAGFDPTYFSLSVGTVLNAMIFRELIREGIGWYDFLGGDDAYKLRWKPEQRTYCNLRCAWPRSAGAFYLRTRRSVENAKSWLRPRIPEHAWSVLRRIYRSLRPPDAIHFEDQ